MSALNVYNYCESQLRNLRCDLPESQLSGKFGVGVRHSCEFLLQVSTHLRTAHLFRASIIHMLVRFVSKFVANLSADFYEFMQIAIDGCRVCRRE